MATTVSALWLVSVVTLGALPGCGTSGTSRPASPPFEVRSQTDVDYSTGLQLDAWIPSWPARESFPALVIVHGGGWVGGRKSEYAKIGPAVARQGFAAFSIDYQLATAAQPAYPAAVRDVLDAVAWVRAHAAGFGVDPHRIGLLGDSAGAHLALLAAMSPDLVRPAEPVAAVAGWSGPYDLVTWRPDPAVLGGTGYRLLSDMRWFLGCTSLDDPACLITEIAASPARVVKAGDPPMLLATSDEYGPGCEIILPSQTTAMAQAARSVGVRVRTDVLHVCGHATGYAAHELGPTLGFFRSALGGPAQL